MAAVTDLPTLLLVAALGGAALLLLERVIASTVLGLSLTLGIVFVNVLGIELQATLVGFRVGDVDVVAGLLLVAGIARLLRARRISVLQWLAIAFGLTVLWSLVTGLLTYGPGTAINDSRTYVRVVAALLYFSTTSPGDDAFDALMTPWLWLTGALVALTFARWGALMVGMGDAWWARADDMRVIDAFRTLVLLQVLLLLWGAPPPVPRRLMAAAPVLLAAVVLLQHRTLWIALAVGAIVWAALTRRLARRVIPAAVAAVVVGGVLSFTLFGGPSTIGSELEDSATNAGTFVWRVEGWRQLVLDRGPDEISEVALGYPFGAGFERRIEGRIVDVTPHNFFVQTYLRTGLVGLGILLALYAGAMRGLLRTPGWGRYLTAPALLVLLVTQLIFLQTSHPSFEQAVLVGLAIATAVTPASRGERTAEVGRRGREPSAPARPPAPSPARAVCA